MANPNFYTVGGTVQAGDGIYIPRHVDEELMGLCRRSIFTYILTSRQMGKSSLMVRTVERLADEDIQSVVVDLTQLGVKLTGEQWYLGLLSIIEDTLMLNTNMVEWWRSRSHLGFTQRLTQFFQEVLLVEVTSPIVIFVDEIDTTLSLDFTDDFFAAIRYLYNARSRMSELQRLSFVLIGVATPGDLIHDPKRTPFNIGQRLDLTDFTWEEALPLAKGWGLPREEGEEVLSWVLNWTGGHPYLTQRLCSTIQEQGKGNLSKADVDYLVNIMFLGAMSKQDNNLQFVRDMLTKRAPDLVSVLTTYQKIRRDRRVQDEEQSLVKSHLKLSGIVRCENNVLQVRNRIYRQVFDSSWIKENLPIPSNILTLKTVFLICMSVTAVTLGMRALKWLQPWELNAYDRMLRMGAQEQPDSRIVIVTINEADLTTTGWPLPDKTINQLLRKIESFQPSVIGLNIYRPGQKNFAVGLKNTQKLIGLCKMSTIKNPEIAPPANFPIQNIGFSDVMTDEDGILRRVLLFAESRDQKCNTNFSFAALLAIDYLKKQNIDYQFNQKTGYFQLGKTIFPPLRPNSGSYESLDAAGYQILLNYRHPNQLARTVTLTQVLKNQVRPEIFKDKLVIIGTIATSVHPGFYTPYSADPKQPARMPAVLIHTQIASQLLSSVLDGRSLITYWSNESETMWILLWSLIGGVITWLFGHSRILSLVVGILMASLVVICNVLFFQAVWVPLIPPALAFVISCFSVLSTSYLIILRLRRG